MNPTANRESSQMQPPGLYLVATPIGNLKDITLRALEILQQADLIVCEDTRVTAKLLNHFGIAAPTLSYNDHNGAQRRPTILKALTEGKRVALVSDAGTPLISDPGYKLAREAIAKGFYLTAIPGASSVLAALCISGLPSDRFFFAGFLSPKKEACRKELVKLASVPSSLVLFESARRLADTLALCHEVLGNREVAVTRELTKRFEEARRGTLEELSEVYAKEDAPKGEVVIVIGPPLEVAMDEKDIEALLRKLLKKHSVKEAASLAHAETNLPRKELYARAQRIKDGEA